MVIKDGRPGGSRAGGLALVSDVGGSVQAFAGALFLDEARARGLMTFRSSALKSGSGRFRGLDAVRGRRLFEHRTSGSGVAILELEDGLARVDWYGGGGEVSVAAGAEGVAETMLAELLERLSPLDVPDDEVPIRFWSQTPQGPWRRSRSIRTPCWRDVAPNYASDAADALEALMTARAPETGRLVLWHGAPGTGKTTALRALARSWADWCSVHCVTDPEELLGAGNDYLVSVLMAEETRGPDWKLVVLEDAGELLAADAHARTGQALSRLLNVTDGMLGQGINVATLITTNEPLGALHPAVTRPGRCWAEIEFGPLSATEANLWLASHASGRRVTQPTTLADLYAILRGREPQPARQFGFARVA